MILSFIYCIIAFGSLLSAYACWMSHSKNLLIMACASISSFVGSTFKLSIAISSSVSSK